MQAQQVNKIKKKKTVIDSFVEGGRNGFQVASTSMVPNVLFAFALIRVLDITGLSSIIGNVCEPVMSIFGLPGIAATVIIASWLSIGGGVGVAASLITGGQLTGTDVTILLPAIMLMGAQLQYMGRILGTSGVKNKYYPHLFTISIINGVLAMFVMRIFI